MSPVYARLCHVPLWGANLRGLLWLHRSYMEFEMPWWQLLAPVQVKIAYRDIADVSPCSYLWFFPAFEIRLKNGGNYIFATPARDEIIRVLRGG